MNTLNLKTESAIDRGLKTVGIGKKGSKSLDRDLAQAILAELKAGDVPPIKQGAFFGALSIKGVRKEEKILEQAFATPTLTKPEKLIAALADDAPESIQNICVQLLKHKELDQQTAFTLGDFLFSNLPGDGARGLIASILRVRYETINEYVGLLKSMNNGMEAPFQEKAPHGLPIIQMAEPFDGVEHSFLVTPLVAGYIQSMGYRVINLVGRNSGPKEGNTVHDLAKELGLNFLQSNDDLQYETPPLGWYVRQKDLAYSIDRWVERRRQIIKRPFIATLEKFLNPANAHIIITSAFHANYAEKMTSIAEAAGYPGSIVVRNGMEGSIGFALKRPVQILCSAKQENGLYQRHEIIFNPTEFLKTAIPLEEKMDQAPLQLNAQLIIEYVTRGKSPHTLFNHRVKATSTGLKQAIEWIEHNLTKGTVQ